MGDIQLNYGRRRTCCAAGISDDDPGSEIVEQLGSTLFGELGIEGDADGPGEQDSQLGDDEIDGPIEADGDGLSGANTDPMQARREIFSGVLKLPIGQLGSPVGYRDG